MFAFEFEGALFQFDEREPEFVVLFQLPPNKAAWIFPGSPFAIQTGNP